MTPDDQSHMETASSRAVEALAYEELVSTGWRVYELNGTCTHGRSSGRLRPPSTSTTATSATGPSIATAAFEGQHLDPARR